MGGGSIGFSFENVFIWGLIVRHTLEIVHMRLTITLELFIIFFVHMETPVIFLSCTLTSVHYIFCMLYIDHVQEVNSFEKYC